jgi:hypothetical protein
LFLANDLWLFKDSLVLCAEALQQCFHFLR